ncbi:hypothetical protein OS493_028151 [Desmophyllum pertusum]|uniref:Uncharacterized protein n=1 Tax=Desmophyllum pertusum TaxID=174260 RepID=A0A9X0CVZ3_9CNID|nr:hypothetical protein OS493_028151 [Desmophyllum pertusum]
MSSANEVFNSTLEIMLNNTNSTDNVSSLASHPVPFEKEIQTFMIAVTNVSAQFLGIVPNRVRLYSDAVFRGFIVSNVRPFGHKDEGLGQCCDPQQRFWYLHLMGVSPYVQSIMIDLFFHMYLLLLITIAMHPFTSHDEEEDGGRKLSSRPNRSTAVNKCSATLSV